MLELIHLIPKMLNIETPIKYQSNLSNNNNFGQKQFKEELTLKQAYLSNKPQFEHEFQKQMEEIIELIFYEYDGGEWRNEFGTMSSYFYEEEKHDNYLENGYNVRFFLDSLSDVIFFKIIPKYSTAPHVQDFLSNIKETGKYDGFVCSKHKHTIYSILPGYKPMTNTFSISNQAIERYNHKNIIYLVKEPMFL